MKQVYADVIETMECLRDNLKMLDLFDNDNDLQAFCYNPEFAEG